MTNLLAHGQDFFDSAFANQHVRAVLLGHHHRHATAGKVKRDFVDLAVGRAYVQLTVHLNMLQHCDIQQVFQAGLVIAVQVSHFQHVVGLLPPDIHVTGEENFVLGQGPGFIGAQHIHCTKVLDRVQPFDDDLFTRQKHSALGQRRGNDHGQHFGGQAHGHRQCKQQGLWPVAFGETVDEQHQRRHHKHKADQ